MLGVNGVWRSLLVEDIRVLEFPTVPDLVYIFVWKRIPTPLSFPSSQFICIHRTYVCIFKCYNNSNENLLKSNRLGLDTFLNIFECPRGIFPHELLQYVSNGVKMKVVMLTK